jgi:CheY-like chemotaxis protein
VRPVSPTVIVVVFEDQVDPALARSALRNRWQILDGRNAGVVRQVMLAHAKAIVVQIPDAEVAVPPAVAMLSRLARHWVPMVLLAVASYGASNAEAAEAAARQAGCDAYLVSPSDEQVDETLNVLLPSVESQRQDEPNAEAVARAS